MKEQIEYYYNLEIDELEELNNKYHFKVNNLDYFFIYYNRSIEELDELITISNSIIDGAKIIVNINNSHLTKIEEYDYILLMINNPREEYNIFDMISLMDKFKFTDVNSMLYRSNWEVLWSDKIDYLEYQESKMALNKSVIRESFSYYIGLAEVSNCYVIDTKRSYANTPPRLVLSHKRVSYPNYKINYLNPLSFVIDVEVRDIAEYLKNMFFKEPIEEVLRELDTYLGLRHLSVVDAQLLMARMIYPSFYFDLYVEVIEKKEEEEKLINIIKRSEEYEIFLKKVYLLINKYTPIAKIDFLTN